MDACGFLEVGCDTDKLSYEIFNILESKFLFGMDGGSAVNFPAIGKLSPDGDQDAVDRFGRGKVCVLSIDGSSGPGGIVSAKALAYLEEVLRRKTGDPDARIADYVDIAAGSGVGGMLTSMLFTKSSDSNRPLFRAEETWKFLVDRARDMFPSRCGIFRRLVGRSPAARFDRLLERHFGESTLRDTLKPILIPCYDLSTSAPLLFSRADAMETDGYDFRIRDVCRVATADPSVRGPVEIISADRRTKCVGFGGGIVMSNPTAEAITHVLNNKHEFPLVAGVEDLIVLSLGEGDQSLSGYVPSSRCTATPIRSSQLMKVASGGISDLVDEAVSMSFGLNRATNYVRVQGNGFEQAELSISVPSSPVNMKRVANLADEMLAQRNVESVLFRGRKLTGRTNADVLEWFADEILKEHGRRKLRVFPTVGFKQASPPRTSSATTASSF